jgi:hypothetical protein
VTFEEAARALAAPEPEPFRQVLPDAADDARWQTWHTAYVAALQYVNERP